MKASRIFSVLSLVLLVVALLGPGASPALAGGGSIFVVNSAGNGSDVNIGDGLCQTSTGKCTLRAAIQEANFGVGLDNIWFNLSGTGIRKIALSIVLPPIVNPVYIDATTQPSCTIPCIELNGAALSGPIIGLNLQTNNSMIKGLIITDFYNPDVVTYGIQILGDYNLIKRNYIGVRPGDAVAHPNGTGIAVQGSNNTIGGTTAADRNVISGNMHQGILLGSGGGAMSGTTIAGNYIGTNPSGTAAMGNQLTGINIQFFVTGTQIGGTTSGARNVISGNGWHGINSMGSGNTIQGNFIGVKANGTGSIPNHYNGIQLYGLSVGNVIGGPTANARNVIAHNGENGIGISSEGNARATIRHNLIYANGFLGIDLNLNGVTANDLLDPDSGPNGLQNYPVIVSATASTNKIVVRLRSQASAGYLIEFYKSPAGTCDPSGYGEARKYLGAIGVATDATGYLQASYTPPVDFTLGQVITATATDIGGNTSEFSHCRVAK